MPAINMTVRIVRTAKVPTAELRGIVTEADAKAKGLSQAVKEAFRPLAQGLRFYVRDDGTTLVSMEMVAFHAKAPGIPFAGVVQTDPIDPEAMQRLDGRLMGELARIGIFTMPDDYETRCEYEGGIE